MKKDRQVGKPSIYYRALADYQRAQADGRVFAPADRPPLSIVSQRTQEIDRRSGEKRRLDYRGMAGFLRDHPELWEKDHGRIKVALVTAKFCRLDTDIVDLDINWLVAKALGRLEGWRERQH
jgi:hypothetical protein